MLNHNNFLIGQLADTDSSQYAMNTLRVEPDQTIATDGHQLTIVSAATEHHPDNFPQTNGAPALSAWNPFLVSRETALTIAKAVSKPNKVMPILNCVAVTETPNGNGDDAKKSYALATTNLETTTQYQPVQEPRSFPDYKRVLSGLDKKPVALKIDFDAALLTSVLQVVAKVIKGVSPNNRCTLTLYDAESALRIDAVGSDGQTITSVVMPLKR